MMIVKLYYTVVTVYHTNFVTYGQCYDHKTLSKRPMTFAVKVLNVKKKTLSVYKWYEHYSVPSLCGGVSMVGGGGYEGHI